MELDAQKIKIVQDILSLQDVAVLKEIEGLLRENNIKEAYEKTLSPMTLGQLEARVEKSMGDYKSGRVKSSKELLKKYDR
ncbi:hypothetical protein [uncultured Algoriphagus sp.]|uniref:hypothetical protein n=1 Tax=uncultured Algoriphagus sp. TaxID=417365 RepID=UPI0030ED0B03|tara:strand:- start:366 stop:605 length:240 start_codon:yes stop_codon:yes gene_type:complete